MELKSKLDKYQSIFSSVDGGPVSPGNFEIFTAGANIHRVVIGPPPPQGAASLTLMAKLL